MTFKLLLLACPVNCQACSLDSSGTTMTCSTCVTSYTAKSTATCDCKFKP